MILVGLFTRREHDDRFPVDLPVYICFVCEFPRHITILIGNDGRINDSPQSFHVKTRCSVPYINRNFQNNRDDGFAGCRCE